MKAPLGHTPLSLMTAISFSILHLRTVDTGKADPPLQSAFPDGLERFDSDCR